MPKKTLAPDTFGPEYEQLLLRAHEGLKTKPEFAVQFADTSIAASIQFKYRKYVRSLKEHATRPDLVAICSDLSTRTAGSALVFFRHSNSADAVAIRAALGLADDFSAVSGPGIIAPPIKTDVDRLRELRASKKEQK